MTPTPTNRTGERGTCAGRPAFTLTELMVAVAVLVVIIVATSRIFGTVNKITAVGTATADVLQEAAAIERQIRADFDRLSRDGFFAIQCAAVANDVNGAVLLNPNLPPDAIVRADKLVFFTQGVESIHNFRLNADYRESRGQSTVARVYYGHAYQLPEWPPFDVDQGKAYDLMPDDQDMYPWFVGVKRGARTTFCTGSGCTNFEWDEDTVDRDATQPPARQWLLSRQAVVLADDDQNGPDANSKTVFLNNSIAGRSIFLNDPLIGWEPQVRDGRVDAAASRLNDIHDRVTSSGASFWPAQRGVIQGRAMYYPRAERLAPSAHRIDQGLTMNVIGTACSSFTVEWTYDFGVGAVPERNYFGLVVDPALEQPWFGYPDSDRGVTTYEQWAVDTGQEFNGSASAWNTTIIGDQHIEEYFPGSPTGLYRATFGYNQDKPYNRSTVPAVVIPDRIIGDVDSRAGYTPWPSAVRITMVLHDAQTKLEAGRTFQFVVRLPRPDR